MSVDPPRPFNSDRVSWGRPSGGLGGDPGKHVSALTTDQPGRSPPRVQGPILEAKARVPTIRLDLDLMPSQNLAHVSTS